jgi:phosphatidylglycerol:prolipoprotein diacylglycerol transferase
MTMPLDPAALVSVFAAITVTPEPIAFRLGPVPVYWYGVCYMVGLAVTYLVITREARRRALPAHLIDNGIIVVAVAALIGGRLYHVIDQWEQLYAADPIKVILPPYTGLGVYGGILTGLLAVIAYTRWKRQPFWRWADVIAPGLFVMQAIGRWGNFFNQELYGPPTGLPWGIEIQCQYRVADYPCASYPEAVTAFHPLFLYESLSGVLGAVTLLWLARRYGRRLRPGDLVLVFFVWYAVVRFALETFRTGNWTFFGVPVAMLVSSIVIVVSLLVLVWRHRPGAANEADWADPEEVEEWVDDPDLADGSAGAELIAEPADPDPDDPRAGTADRS